MNTITDIRTRQRARPLTRTAPALDMVVPVYDEEHDLEPSVRRLHGYLEREFPFSFRITIADNASRDRTWAIARRLRDELEHVEAVHLERKGRGRALREVWSRSDAEVVAYMDVDLSTGLDALLPLVAPLLSGHSELSIGSRLARSAHVRRGLKTRDDLALLKPHPPPRPAGPVLRPSGVGGVHATAGRGLVLRHRAARPRGARRATDTRGAGRLGRRSRLPRRHRQDRARRPPGRLPAPCRSDVPPDPARARAPPAHGGASGPRPRPTIATRKELQ